ncbi:phosphotriesterase family protein [Leucobacter sp.]
MSAFEAASGTDGGFVRTVLGDVAPDALGAVNYHEHFFQRSPLLPGDDLDDPARSEAEAGDLRDSGFAAVVDATPVGLGRRPEDLAALARRTGLRVIATTGRHRDAHYGDRRWLLDLDAGDLAEVFLGDLVAGMPCRDPEDGGVDFETAARTTVRAGVLKAGVDYWRVSTSERVVLEAVGAAHRRTGAPVMVHTEHCTAVDAVLDLLAQEGVAADRVVIAHADRTPDPGLHAAIAARGAYLGYDGAGRHKDWPDSVLIDSLSGVVRAGYGDRVLLGADVARASRYRAYGGIPGLSYLGRVFVPRLRARIGDEAMDRVLVRNPAEWLTWSTAVSA